MSIIKGSLYAVTEFDIAVQSLYGSKVLYVGESRNDLPQGFIGCSVLLPPFEAVSAEVDGDMQSYTAIYGQYLTFSEQCYGMFATILIALNRGVNITMYIENGSELSHFNFLLSYIEGTFGIVVGTAQREFSYNPLYDAQNAAILYSYMDGFILEQEFMAYQNDLALLINLEQAHPYIKPLKKLIEKHNLYNVDLASWFSSYKFMIGTGCGFVPGMSMITIETEE